MNEKRNGSHPPAAGMALNDIYYVLFRHKWKIIVLTVLGLLTAGGIYFYRGTTYQSEANLWIKYVMSTRPLSPTANSSETISVTEGGDGIINTEVAILSSFDLARQVATNIGPEKILAMAGGGSDVVAAATFVHDNLVVDRLPRSPVLRVIFSHPDKDLVQRILQEIVDDYQKKHAEMYTVANSSYDALMRETGNLKVELEQAEANLQRAKNEAGINDLTEAKKSNGQMILTIHQEIMQTAAEMEQHQEILKQLQGADAKSSGTNLVSSTNSLSATNTLAELTDDQIDDYTLVKENAEQAKTAYFKLRSDLPEHNSLVVEKYDKHKSAEKVKKDMEKADPRLAKLRTTAPVANGAPFETVSDKIAKEQDTITGLQDKIKALQTSMQEVHSDVTNLDALTPAIRDLERQVENRETYYKNYLNSFEQARIENDIGGGKNANIQVTQLPSPPSQERSKTPKLMGIAAAAGILIGLIWAFFVELYLDHSVRRPKEIEGALGMRLFLSIPDVNRNGERRLGNGASKKNGKPGKAEPPAALPAPADGLAAAVAAAAAPGSKMEVAPWDRNHSLHNYYEALRDRLISYFEVNNLNHKPKLVAVTGSAQGSGATTIAAGLAASLSETGDGNVLLIDMNLEHGATQEFYNGKPSCELDAALANETRDSAMVQNNLYVVSGRANGDQLSRMLPKRFANLLPKLKASDYDFIIFDMPPIARTGVTQRLAGFMDMMLLVVEAEKTSRDVVKQAGALLTESKANVSVVLNKTHTYIPKRFHQEF